MAEDFSGEGYRGGVDVALPVAMTMAAFTGIAVFNVLEINVSIFTTFQRRMGLYFWSLLAASWGIPIHAIGFLLKFFRLCRNDTANVAVITVGWFAMVTGQSIVLYSRLHLIVRRPGREQNQMGFGAHHCRLFSLPYSSHSPQLWCQLHEPSTVPRAIFNLRKNSDHGILDAGIYHLGSVHLGSSKDAAIDCEGQARGSPHRPVSSHMRECFDYRDGHHAPRNGIRQSICHSDDIQEYTLQRQIEAGVRHPESTSCSSQITTQRIAV